MWKIIPTKVVDKIQQIMPIVSEAKRFGDFLHYFACAVKTTKNGELSAKAYEEYIVLLPLLSIRENIVFIPVVFVLVNISIVLKERVAKYVYWFN